MNVCQPKELSTDPKVVMTIKNLKNATKPSLLLALSTFCHDKMDGAIRTISLDQFFTQSTN